MNRLALLVIVPMGLAAGVGAMKISDHHVRSPVLNLNRACQTCHGFPEAELRGRIVAIQDRIHQLRNVALDALLALVGELAAARRSDSASPRVRTAQRYQRAGQFFIDFVERENSMRLHTDQEAARILARAIDYVRRGREATRRGLPDHRARPPRTAGGAGRPPRRRRARRKPPAEPTSPRQGTRCWIMSGP
ncbi:MAG TPA: ammonia-forming cytochrome c nitrite reductase subunit c552 [Gemmatimonadales bacterium]|nr:ammonia-forming cytochrome c nitrite reductase subunit c552 [Gemmatimonadales bacterium]